MALLREAATFRRILCCSKSEARSEVQGPLQLCWAHPIVMRCSVADSSWQHTAGRLPMLSLEGRLGVGPCCSAL